MTTYPLDPFPRPSTSDLSRIILTATDQERQRLMDFYEAKINRSQMDVTKMATKRKQLQEKLKVYAEKISRQIKQKEQEGCYDEAKSIRENALSVAERRIYYHNQSVMFRTATLDKELAGIDQLNRALQMLGSSLYPDESKSEDEGEEEEGEENEDYEKDCSDLVVG